MSFQFVNPPPHGGVDGVSHRLGRWFRTSRACVHNFTVVMLRGGWDAASDGVATSHGCACG